MVRQPLMDRLFIIMELCIKLKEIVMKKLFLFLCLFTVVPVNAKHVHSEKYYQELWCNEHHGVMEYKLDDHTRVDCLTEEHAIEFDFGSKWAEAIGQALHYSYKTGKKAGIVLILEQPKDDVYYNRIVPLCEKYNITLWCIRNPF